MAYVDLQTRFTYNIETVFGDFSKLANNDAFLNNNGWQDGTMGIFFQAAAPTGWTKNILISGYGLRVTSGSGGGVAGTNDPGSSISLAHTHSITTDPNHTHQILAHTHHLAISGTDQASGSSPNPLAANGSDDLQATTSSSGSTTSKANTLSLNGGPYSTDANGSHSHGGATDSSLSSIVLAYANIIFCSKDTSTGYTDLTATFVHNVRHVFDYLMQLATNDAFNYARRTPAGTISIFYSAASPTGWTKIATNNAQLLRAVNDGSGSSSGGSADPATTISLAHNHNTSSDGGHTHTSPAHVHKLADKTTHSPTAFIRSINVRASQLRRGASTGGVAFLSTQDFTNTDGSVTTSSAGIHTHTVGTSLGNINLAYVNVIQASKDSAGAPQAYTDYTAFFVDQALLAYQDLQVLAYNDAYLFYHTIPVASTMFFFQAAAPLNWTKLTTQNDALLRIVNDSSGGTNGGSDLISGISLAHSHTLSTASVSHTATHSHTLAQNGTSVVTGSIGDQFVFGQNDAELYTDTNGGSGDNSLGNSADTQSLSTDTYSHNHGGTTGSSLSALSLAYADVILCSKN